jgi:hypothetical protein
VELLAGRSTAIGFAQELLRESSPKPPGLRTRGGWIHSERFDGEVLGVYGVRDGKFARAQMFYLDSAAVLRFLDAARADEPEQV